MRLRELDSGDVVEMDGGTLRVAGPARRITPRVLAAVVLLAAGAAYLALSSHVSSAGLALAGVVAVGPCLGGTVLHALAPTLYPTSTRATGVGWTVATARVGALTAPVLAGVLLGPGWSPWSLLGLLPLLVAAADAVVAFTPISQRPAVAAAGSTILGQR
ncbi:hypothetical protein [Streptomyces sp. Inha503]|uniref:hypothetical protein n=1 Tax=Streptomyces sp. Inha503 TaxID=3383314 RepID=UPI0039A39FE8